MSQKSILILRCGALGDLVYATSIIDALLSEFGTNTKIDFICTPATATLFTKDTRISKVFTLKHKKIPIVFSHDKKTIIRHSKNTPYDLFVNFENGKQFKSLVHAIHAKRKIGFFFDGFTPSQSSSPHMVDIIKSLFKNIVSSEVFDKSFPRLIGTPREEIRQKFQLPNKYLIISPSNSHQKKNKLNHRAWMNQYWQELISLLEQNVTVVIVGSKNEEDFFNKLRPFSPNVIDLVGKTSLPDLVGIIENAEALIATDTGTAHIASAVNTEVFALIGPTPANITGPYKNPFNKVHIITAGLQCSPCYKTETMKKCKDNICMKQITPTQVYKSVKSANIV